MKKTKLALLQSVISLLLCVSMLLGTTFAWFTDSVTSENNIIVSGTLKVGLDWKEAPDGAWKDASEGAIFDYSYWEPGYTQVRYVRITNKGNLAFRYRLNILPAVTPAQGEVNLADVIDVYLFEAGADVSRDAIAAATPVGTLSQLMADPDGAAYGRLLATDAPVECCIVLKMQETAGNEYQNKSVGSFKVMLLATQETYENDSFGPDYDAEAQWPAVAFPSTNLNESVSGTVNVADNKVAEDATLQGNAASAQIPAGVQVSQDKLTLSVSEKESSDSNIVLGENEALRALDVHMDGVAADNTQPMEITIRKMAPVGLNMGNYKLYHVEPTGTVEMAYIAADAPFTAHNQFKYDPATGDVTLYMATFSEVAMVAEESKWEGNFDYSWYTNAVAPVDGEAATEYIIANADQLAGFGAIVGGMDGQTQNSFAGKTVKLIADINLGDANNANEDLIFHPIGYYYKDGDSTVKSFEGTFNGNGHSISDFYQNTWEIKGDYDGTYYKDAMGLFGYVYNGTVKNLTVANFSSDGEYTPTGVIAAFADGNSTFENIAIVGCNPRVYNTGNGGIIGIAGDTSAANDDHITLMNITVDNSNKISALWGSWDVACGGLVGMYRGNVDGNGNATGDTISFENCHVSAIIDVYNDVCANYQYYAYRYSGMIIGSVRHNTTNDEGKTIPNMTGISATGCTVNYGDWNDYYYCEFEKNTMASYSEDYQFSRVPHSELNFTDSNGNGVVDADERASVTGCTHTHTAAENHQAIYLPFHQLFTGYSWGVSSIGLEKYSGVVTNLDITEGDQEKSVEKFETKFTGDFLYRVGNKNTVSLGSLFAAKNGATISNAGVWVTVEKVNENMNVGGTFTADTSDWTKGTIQFSGTGVVKVTIQDYNFCKPTVLYLEVVDAVNATSATNATANNVVLLNDISSGFTVSGRYTVYGNGFTATYIGNGQYLNNGLKQGVVTVSENGMLDNLRIVASVYPVAYLYYSEAQNGDSDGNNRYYYQFSAVAAFGNATISNCYIYGGRNNIYIGDGNVTVKDSVLECGTLANVQIISSKDYTVTFENVTTIQHQMNATIGTESNVMFGAGILVGDGDKENTSATAPKIVLNGDFKQYNWVTAEDKKAVSDSNAKMIIGGALDATAYNHTVNEETASNLGIIYLNEFDVNVVNNTGLPYEKGTVSLKLAGVNVSRSVYSLQKATTEQIYSDYANADKSTENDWYQPQFKYAADLGGQYVAKTDDGDEHFYREGDTIKVMFPSGESKEINLATIVDIAKYTDQSLELEITIKNSGGNTVAVTNGKTTLSEAGEYTVTYAVTDKLFYDQDGSPVTQSKKYSWDVVVSVSLKEVGIPDAYFSFEPSVQQIFRSGNSNIVQFIPFLSGLKIYDYDENGNKYLRFDGGNTEGTTDYDKITSATINNINTTGEAQGYHIVTIELSDGGKLVIDMDVRANSGSSKHSGSIKVRNNVIYVVNDGTTSGKGQTWKIYSYKFVGNNGTEIDSGLITFGTAGTDCRTATKPTGTFNSGSDGSDNDSGGGGSECITSGTLITLADGTQKPVEDLVVGDMIMVFNHVTGKYEAAPLIFNTHADENEAKDYDVLYLQFSDGKELKIVESHGLFDMTLMQYVYITDENYHEYIGHEFYAMDDDGVSGKNITLTNAFIQREKVRIFCPVTYFHMNSFANGLLNTPNIPGGITGLVNYFEYDPDLKYNEEAMQRDIEKYGLYTYADFSEYISEAAYNSSPAVFLKVAVGKGMITHEQIVDIILWLLDGSLIN